MENIKTIHIKFIDKFTGPSWGTRMLMRDREPGLFFSKIEKNCLTSLHKNVFW